MTMARDIGPAVIANDEDVRRAQAWRGTTTPCRQCRNRHDAAAMGAGGTCTFKNRERTTMVANHSFLFGGRPLKRCLAAATAGVAAMAFAVMGVS